MGPAFVPDPFALLFGEFVLFIDMAIRLVIDPGHGMGNIKKGVYDPGAEGGGMAEADIALLWALAGRFIGIHEYGLKPEDIVMTRDERSDIMPVSDRAKVAKEANCTHFLALHCNSSDDKKVTGTETYHPKVPRGQADDLAWAKVVQKCALKATKLKDRKVKREDESQHPTLAVFNEASSMSACLLEIGFISNKGDRAVMSLRDTRVAFWRGLFEALGFAKVG